MSSETNSAAKCMITTHVDIAVDVLPTDRLPDKPCYNHHPGSGSSDYRSYSGSSDTPVIPAEL